MESDVILEQAALASSDKTDLPSPSSVVAALLAVERAKQQKISYSFEQLIGTWRLCFVTGTKKSRQRAGIVLGAGRYIPRFVNISLNYSSIEPSPLDRGRVENRVNLAALQLSLTGPVRFLSPKNLLAFDFTRMNLKLFGVTLYNGYIRAGKAEDATVKESSAVSVVREESFYTDKISHQAFFAYFYIGEKAIAARGKGGGLALWSRVE